MARSHGPGGGGGCKEQERGGSDTGKGASLGARERVGERQGDSHKARQVQALGLDTPGMWGYREPKWRRWRELWIGAVSSVPCRMGGLREACWKWPRGGRNCRPNRFEQWTGAEHADFGTQVGGPIMAKSAEPREENPRTLGSGGWRVVPRRRAGGPPGPQDCGRTRSGRAGMGSHSAHHPTPSSLLQDPPTLSHRTRWLAISAGGNATPGHRRSPTEPGHTRAPATSAVALTCVPKSRQRTVTERRGETGAPRAALRAAGLAPLLSCLSKRSHRGSAPDTGLGANAQSAGQPAPRPRAPGVLTEQPRGAGGLRPGGRVGPAGLPLQVDTPPCNVAPGVAARPGQRSRKLGQDTPPMASANPRPPSWPSPALGSGGAAGPLQPADLLADPGSEGGRGRGAGGRETLLWFCGQGGSIARIFRG